MIYLINYDRVSGSLVSIVEFSDKERLAAAKAKLLLEISLLNKPGAHEVVLLEAESKERLHVTHRRYFASFEDMKVQVRPGSAT